MTEAQKPLVYARYTFSYKSLLPEAQGARSMFEGVAIMRANRGVDRLRDLARGPGRLCAALRIDRSLDGLDLCNEGPLWLGRDDHESGEIGESIRIGISKDADRPLRFYLRGSSFVSGPKALNA